MIKILNYTTQAIKVLPNELVNFTNPVPNHEIPYLLTKCKVFIPEQIKTKSNITRTPSKLESDTKINITNIGQTDGLPEPRKDVFIIVSAHVYMSYHRKREDLLVIDEPIRSDSGQIICCRALSKPKYSIDDNYIKSVANKFDSSYRKILDGMQNNTDYESLKKVLIDEEPNLFKAIVQLSNLTK